MQDGVSEKRETEGISLAVIKEVVDRLHRGIIACSLAERGGHTSRDIDTELDVGHDALRSRFIPFLGAGENKNDDDEQKGWHGLRDANDRAGPPSAPLHAVVERQDDSAPASAPRPDEEKRREEQEEEDPWISKRNQDVFHDHLPTVAALTSVASSNSSTAMER